MQSHHFESPSFGWDNLTESAMEDSDDADNEYTSDEDGDGVRDWDEGSESTGDENSLTGDSEVAHGDDESLQDSEDEQGKTLPECEGAGRLPQAEFTWNITDIDVEMAFEGNYIHGNQLSAGSTRDTTPSAWEKAPAWIPGDIDYDMKAMDDHSLPDAMGGHRFEEFLDSDQSGNELPHEPFVDSHLASSFISACCRLFIFSSSRILRLKPLSMLQRSVLTIATRHHQVFSPSVHQDSPATKKDLGLLMLCIRDVYTTPKRQGNSQGAGPSSLKSSATTPKKSSAVKHRAYNVLGLQVRLVFNQSCLF